MAGRARQILKALADGPYDDVAFFCHGLLSSLQAGFRKGSVERLARALGQPNAGRLVVYLFACDAAKGLLRAPGGDGGFADALRDTWCRVYPQGSITVFAHATAGHTTKNPFLRVFEEPAGIGGHWVITPQGSGGRAGEWRLWKTYLRNDGWLDIEGFRQP
jgi:hypothetical protein